MLHLRGIAAVVTERGGRLWRAVHRWRRTVQSFPAAIFRSVRRRAISFGQAVCRIPGQILHSPVATYRRVLVFRNWFLAKVEYLQAESARWKVAFNLVKSPYSLLRALGLSPQMAGTLLFASSAAAGGVVVNETVFAERSFARGDAGVYSAPLDRPISYTEGVNTLRVDLGATQVGSLILENLTVGTAYADSTLPSGETNVVLVGGLPTVADPAFTGTYLYVGHLTVDRWRCTQLTLSNIEVHTLNVKWNASDGQSIGPVPGTPRNRGVGGGNRAESMTTSGGYYDQIKLTAASSGQDAYVDTLTLSNLYTKGGGCVLDRIKAGTIDILLNEVGNGDGFALKDFTIETSVVYSEFNNISNVEESISPPS